MKKILSLVMCVALLAGLMAIAISASGYNPCDTSSGNTVTIKKANAADVIKDGVIGANEYVQYQANNSDSALTDLWMNFGTAAVYGKAESMVTTMKYYFSWDDTHGFNFAVIAAPEDLAQVLSEGTGNPPEDNFLCNTGIQFSSDITKNRANGKIIDTTLYYAVARRTDTGAYLEGHYNQLGQTGSYDPEPGVDYAISYPGDGTVVFEWSIPFAKFTSATGNDGEEIYFTIAVTSGTATQETASDRIWDEAYSVSLGDYGWLCPAGQMKDPSSGHVTGILSTEAIASDTSDDTGDSTTSTTSTTGTTSTTTTDDDQTTVNGTTTDTTTTDTTTTTTTDDGSSAGTGTTTNGTTAAQTADPIIAVAAVCALSAGAVLVLRKKVK